MSEPTPPPARSAISTPALVYAPGLGSFPENSAAGVADVIAAVLDRRHPGRYTSTIDAKVAAPRGLKVGKSVVDEHGNTLLHVFELDYTAQFRSPANAAGPPPTPGIVRSSLLALRATGMFVGALRRGAKTGMAKLQLGLAFFAICLLVFVAVVAVVAGLVAIGVGLPRRIEDFFDGDAASITFATFGVVAVVSWTGVRRWLLATAVTTQRAISYVDNDDRHSDTVTLTVDLAVDGLRDVGWTGPVHLLGYSFGSLVLFDAMFPRPTSHRSAGAVASVRSLTTIGCPLDAVRLFRPRYADARAARVPTAEWCNVFIATDVFGSNLRNGDDVSVGSGASVDIAGAGATSIRYLDERLTWGTVLRMRGFRSHAGYWGGPEEGSCFDALVDRWYASPSSPAPR